MPKALWLIPALAAVSVLDAAAAEAFTVRTTGDGIPVHWETDAISIVTDGSLRAIDPAAIDAAESALASWGAVPGAGPPKAALTEGAIDEVGYRVGEDNASTLRYMAGGYAPAGPALAITVLTFDSGGVILDADVVVNGQQDRLFAVLPDAATPGAGPYDVQDVLTHEFGHFFGLGHDNGAPDATMFFSIGLGETKKRSLASSDTNGLRFLYPPGSEDTAAALASCAATEPRSGPPGGWIAAALLGLGLVAAARTFGGRKLRYVSVIVPAIALAAAQPSRAESRTALDAGAGAANASGLARVTRVTPRWERGLLVTELSLQVERCEAGGCPGGMISIQVYGGTLDGITQVVGSEAVPVTGGVVPLRWAADRSAWSSKLPARWTGAVR